ncbi:MAG: putative integral rane protein, partial [Planctomycetaceae bacterium]|nr:putative integral rane protein [Planctomycetaceae bacterium]
SRAVCVTALILGSALFPIERYYELRKANPNAGPKQDLQRFYQDYAAGFREVQTFGDKPMLFVSPGGRDSWAKPFVHWDAVWWLSVAEVGYVADPKLKAEQNVVFYPLFPLAVRSLSLLGLPPLVAALLTVNGTLLVVTCLLYRLVVLRSGIAAARWTLAFWLSFPAALFGVVPYSESLMALLTVLAMQALLDGKSVRAGLWCGLASALRNQGVILGGALVVPFLTGPYRFRALVGLACSGLGLFAYMAYLQNQFGDPFLFVAVQKQWRPKLGDYRPWSWLFVLLQSSCHSVILAINPKSPKLEFYSARILDPWLGWWILAWLSAVRRLDRGLLLSSAVMLALPLSTGTVASLGRYVWVILPVFVVMGESLYKSGWRWPILITSTVGLLWQSFLFGGGWEVI